MLSCLPPQTTECRERPVECQFCRVAVRLSKLEIHTQHCGNRTELCLGCGQLVVVRALAQHREACATEQAQHSAGEQGRLGARASPRWGARKVGPQQGRWRVDDRCAGLKPTWLFWS